MHKINKAACCAYSASQVHEWYMQVEICCQFGYLHQQSTVNTNVSIFITGYSTTGTSTPVSVSVHLCGLGSGQSLPAHARLRRIDATHANPQAAWQAMGSR